MMEPIIAFLNKMMETLYCVPVSPAIEEIFGGFLILALLFILRKVRKRRKTGPAGEKIKTGNKGYPADGPIEKDMEEAGRGPLYEGLKDGGTPAPESDKLENPIIPVMEKESPESLSPVSETPGDAAGLLHRLKSGLSKTRQSLSRRVDGIFSNNRRIDAAVIEEIEETLITSDIGVPTTMTLMARISKKADNITSADAFKRQLKAEMLSLLDVAQTEIQLGKPHVIMVVGVNGVGKTTTIGKLAAKFSAQGKKVLLSAADTFRAAAADQLAIWAKRANADIVRHKDNSDPAAVAFDSVEAAIARGMDVVIIDTAGRLHTKVNLMEELKKIKRSIVKKIPLAPHETLLVLDATTGQNAVSQAKIFNADIGITGIVLTKLDGTAKGGIVLGICDLLKTPIRYIGVGEGMEDLQEFDPRLFVEALL
ncbi:MAG: signal recognition particle-docking protein FtsY [Desulfobacteraceae bacterium]|nr:signal recognition particle-docking protein FtsY [Desulfobacteraceae bacterium]